MTQSSNADYKSSNDVLIAGCGIAAAFFALRAVQFGFKPILLRVPTPPPVAGVEMIPASTSAMLDAIAFDEVLAATEPGFGESLLRRHADGREEWHLGRTLHVDRLRLRNAALDAAVRRGAQIRDMKRLPPPSEGCFCIDATGQKAAWSKPVRRIGREVADIFTALADGRTMNGQIAHLEGKWAYVASDAASTTVGIIGHPDRARHELDDEILEALGLPTGIAFVFRGRRPAFVQWSSAIAGWRLSVGDAAVHHSPIGGRGIGFALGSAFAAVSVLTTWRDHPANAHLARSYYADFNAAEARRHLAFLSGAEVNPPVGLLPVTLLWCGVRVAAPLVVQNHVVAGTAFQTATGTQVRWAGGFDLALLERLSAHPVDSQSLISDLQDEGLIAEEARELVNWAWRKGLLTAPIVR